MVIIVLLLNFSTNLAVTKQHIMLVEPNIIDPYIPDFGESNNDYKI